MGHETLGSPEGPHVGNRYARQAALRPLPRALAVLLEVRVGLGIGVGVGVAFRAEDRGRGRVNLRAGPAGEQRDDQPVG